MKIDFITAKSLTSLSYIDRPQPYYGIDLLKNRIIKAAQFAVEDHNLEMKTDFKLVGIEKAATMIGGPGIIYFLILKAQNEDKDENVNPPMVFITAVLYRCNHSMDSIGLKEYTSPLEAEKTNTNTPHYRQKRPTPNIENAAKAALEGTRWELVDVADWNVVDKKADCVVYSITLVARCDQSCCTVFEAEVTKTIDLTDDSYNSYSPSSLRGMLCVPKFEKSPVPPPRITTLQKFLGEFVVKEHNRNNGTQVDFVDCISFRCDVDDAYRFKYLITLQVIDGETHKIFSTEAMEINSSSSAELDFSDVIDDVQAQSSLVNTVMNDSYIEDDEDSYLEDDEEKPNSVVLTGLKYVSDTTPQPKAQVVLPYESPDWISSQFLSQVDNMCRCAYMLEDSQQAPSEA